MRERLVVQGQGEEYVASDLAGVQLAVKAAQLNRAVAGEKAVQVDYIMLSYA